MAKGAILPIRHRSQNPPYCKINTYKFKMKLYYRSKLEKIPWILGKKKWQQHFCYCHPLFIKLTHLSKRVLQNQFDFAEKFIHKYTQI
jgi:hypothetical protein